MRPGRLLAILLVTAAAALAGCGSAEEPGSSTKAPPKAEFPSAKGKTLQQVLEGSTPSSYVVSPAAAAFFKGENRVPFGVFEKGGTQVTDAEVALYFAKAPDGKGKAGDAALQG